MTVKNRRVLILANIDVSIYNTRRELIQLLISQGYEVYISCLYGDRVKKLEDLGCKYVETDFSRHSINPFKGLSLINFYRKNMKAIKPSIVLTYSIKQNIYGGISANILNIPFIANITGLGPALDTNNMLKKVVLYMYRVAFKKAKCVFFQNDSDLKFFVDNKVNIKNKIVIPGSGVNLEDFNLLDYPNDEIVNFLYLSRIVKEKGIDQYLETASVIHKKYPNTIFNICGFCEDSYKEKIHCLTKNGDVVYHGMVSDVKEVLKTTHCTIHPSYYPEGMSNVLLESCACGRPIITTNRVGCKEVVDNGQNGFLIEQQNSEDLIDKIEKFLKLSYKEKRQMGLVGRIKVEQEFDRKVVINAYIKEIENNNSFMF